MSSGDALPEMPPQDSAHAAPCGASDGAIQRAFLDKPTDDMPATTGLTAARLAASPAADPALDAPARDVPTPDVSALSSSTLTSSIVPPSALPPSTLAVAALSAITFGGTSALGISLPILPPRLHLGMGFDLTIVGWVIGLESIATLVTRPWSGTLTDRKGGRHAAILGLWLMALCGLTYLLADILPIGRIAALMLILVGRVLMGAGEGFLLSGAGLWAIERAGPRGQSRAVAWIGLGFFGGLAGGAVLGAAIDHGQQGGFAVACIASIIIPLLCALACLPMRRVPGAAHHDDAPLKPILKATLKPGLSLFANSCGFAAITSFLSLHYAARGWSGAGVALASFSIGHVFARLVFSEFTHLVQNRIPVLLCFLCEAVGLILVWAATTPAATCIGAAVTGLGFSMIYPLLTAPLLRVIPRQRIGIAFAIYDAFFDVGAGIAAMCSGVVGRYLNIADVFLLAAISVICGAVPVMLTPRQQWAQSKPDA